MRIGCFKWWSRSSRIAAHGVLAVAMLLPGCSGHHADPAVAGPDSAPYLDSRFIITRVELADSRVVGGTVFDAIRILRPIFLLDASGLSQGSGSATEASINGGRPRPLRELDGISASEAVEIRYLSVGEGQKRFGVRSRMGPIILVSLRSTTTTDPMPFAGDAQSNTPHL